ncbi:sulfotransferase family protein [Desulfobacter postgatei]|uniref:Sulfotransferase family protein n=1 Tax=Desulfobacter postgatei 2ac9 TaxID=879212 RepID=I5B5W6_9BACT|nr:sulfotransferase family protein [Desulfobacter postgatei]EIM64879.1 hypothetical protein DespoDRAFT_03071 [Desulfobacter postgatei 2ac9]
MNNKSIIVCTGAPRSGVKALATCLQVLGFPTGNHIQPDPETIDRLLLQDLGQPAGSLPYDWMASEAYSRAKGRIGNFISQTGTLPDKPLQVNLNALTLPLWLDTFKKHEITVKLIHILRHPYEVALSLQSNQNMDLHQAHILWLSHIRETLRALNELDYSSVTFDQLLADPVSTLNTVFGSSLTSVLRSLTSDLLDLVQPDLKNHHASNLSDADKEKFKPYAKLYDQLRATQYASSALNSYNQRIKSIGSSEIDLIDSLLNVISMLEGSRHYHHCSLPVANFHLYATITFPTTSKNGENGVVMKTIPLIENQWQEISLPVPNPELLTSNNITIHPLNTHGFIKVSNINLVNKVTEKAIWEANKVKDFDQVNITGSAIRLNSSAGLTVLVTGNDPTITLPVFNQTWDVSSELHVCLKVSTQQDELTNFLPLSSIRDKPELAA